MDWVMDSLSLSWTLSLSLSYRVFLLSVLPLNYEPVV
jgi:hypothetical protein